MISFALFSSVSLPLLVVEETKQGNDGENTEAYGADINCGVASTDCLDLKQIGGLICICCLPESHLFVIGVVSIGSYEVRGSRHVTLNSPIEGLGGSVGGAVRSSSDLVLASPVLF